MFLPKYIDAFFDNASFTNGKSLVSETHTLYSASETKYSEPFIFSPLVILSLISLIIIWLTLKNYKNNSRSKWLDTAIFSTTSIVGILLLLLWFATDHSGTANNYNLLWAFPFNMILAIGLLKTTKKKWMLGYVKFLILLLCLLTLHWIVGVQMFAIGLIPLLIALTMHYLFLANHIKLKGQD